MGIRKMILKNITLVCIDCNQVGNAVASIKKTLSKITPFKTILFTDSDIHFEGIDTVQIESILSKEQYSHFVVKELHQYITTPHCLIVQHDSWVLNEDVWTDEFLDYDVIGALWLYNDGRDNGNGGFCIKSKRLLDILATDNLIEITHPEDEICGRLYRGYLEKNHNIKFAPEHLCDLFSFECREPYQRTFGFHSVFHEPFKEHVVIRRPAACGDVVMAEPLIQYYHDRGYQVVLDTLPEMMAIFYNHPFRVKHISEMNTKAIPGKVINLEMSYESKPKQRVLETYYEFAGIKDAPLRNSRLYVNMTREQRLFKKYIVFHTDDTGMKYRNAYGVNWNFVVWNFTTRFGYTCIQVGKRDHEEFGTYFNTETKEMLLYVLNGADAVVGIDSGITQLAVALGRPTAILTGSVDLNLRYVDFTNIQVIKNACPKPEHEYCYHNQSSSVTGSKCIIDENRPPCTANFTEHQVIGALNKLLKLN